MVTLRCRVCGCSFAGRPDRLYCSDRCKNGRVRVRYVGQLRPCSVEGCVGMSRRTLCETHRSRRREGLTDCETMGCARLAVREGYCSTHAPVAIPYATCHCGAVYVKHGGGVHCKAPKAAYDPARAKVHYRRWADKHSVGVSHDIACRICGASFVGKRGRALCGDACRAIADRESDRRAKDHREARQRDAFVERIYRRKVYERDGWRCQLCHKPVNRMAVVPHPQAPVLDHILPLAKGGKHAYANVQTAHFLCNSIKSAGVFGGAEQLRLVG